MSDKHKIEKVPLQLYVGLSITAWAVAWLSTQAIFMFDIPVLTHLLLHSDNAVASFTLLSAWICMVGLLATIAWAHWSRSNFSFLKMNKWVALAYAPIALGAVLVALTPEQYGIPGWLWIAGVLATTFVQDILTFGFLQTALTTRLKDKLSFILTAVIFFLGHFLIVGSDPTIATLFLYSVAFVLFAYLRYKTKTIYATNILHSAFYIFTAFL